MATGNFKDCLKLVAQHEGGRANNPADPGGLTLYGITAATYSAWRKARNLPPRSVEKITQDEVELIMRSQFWDTVRGDELPAGVDYTVFDASVNSGPAQSIKWLQRALGVTADGKIGPVTLAAVKADKSPAAMVDDMLNQRLAFMKKIKHKTTGALLWTTFGKGWQRRVDEVRRDALAMIAGSSRPAPSPEPLRPTPQAPQTFPLGALLVGLLSLGLVPLWKYAQPRLKAAWSKWPWK